MCQQGLLNVYALADPLVEQDNKHFMTTIQVGGWVGGQRSTGSLRVAVRRALWGIGGGGSPSRAVSTGAMVIGEHCAAQACCWVASPRPPAPSNSPLLPQLPVKRRLGVDPYARE